MNQILPDEYLKRIYGYSLCRSDQNMWADRM